MNMKTFYFHILVVVFFSSPSAFAGNEDRASTGLPGVEPQKPIVSAPPPAPEPDQQQTGSWKNFRVGNTDVSISGDITIDVGTGGAHGSRRR